MSRTLNEILAALPEDQRQHVETRADELRQEIEAPSGGRLAFSP
jgi:hypothetical protein